MKKFFIYLLLTTASSVIVFVVWQNSFQISQQEILVLYDNKYGFVEAKTDRSIYFYPRFILPRQVTVFRVPLVQQDTSFKYQFSFPFSDFLFQQTDYKLQIELIVSYRPIAGKGEQLFSQFALHQNDLLNQLKGYFERKISKKIGILFSNVNEIQKTNDNFQNILRSDFPLWKKELNDYGLELIEIDQGANTNLVSFGQYLKDGYFSTRLQRLLLEHSEELLKIRQAQEKEKIALANIEEKKKLLLDWDIARIEKYAQLLKRFPEAYKVMLLERINFSSEKKEASDQDLRKLLEIDTLPQTQRPSQNNESKEKKENTSNAKSIGGNRTILLPELKPGQFYGQ